MGHMPAPGRACLSLLCPPAHSVPTCLKLTFDNVQEQIYKLAKKDLTPSQIVECMEIILRKMRLRQVRSVDQGDTSVRFRNKTRSSRGGAVVNESD
uniref:Small ribosomal subunit protein uS15 N-terminal domain-containing protein n=1 Tax=Sus scrofa TaxID=9823 RepID=A0A4X1U475_PIG